MVRTQLAVSPVIAATRSEGGPWASSQTICQWLRVDRVFGGAITSLQFVEREMWCN
jgi:hypothetical protein